MDNQLVSDLAKELGQELKPEEARTVGQKVDAGYLDSLLDRVEDTNTKGQ